MPYKGKRGGGHAGQSRHNKESSQAQTQNQNVFQGNRNQNSNLSNIQCRKCSQFGHYAKECPSNNNNNHHQHQDNNNGASGNAPSIRQEKKCIHHPHLNNHNTEECKKAGAKKRRESNGSVHTFYTGIPDGPLDVHMESAPIPMPSTRVCYCRGCNSTDHQEQHCPNGQESSYKLLYCREACWRCLLRGHTGDECRNPSQKSCDRCHKAGHRTEDCKNTSSVRLDLLRTGQTANRFRWHIPDAKVEDDLFGERYRFALKQTEFNRRMDNNPLTRQEWEDAQKEIAMKEARLCWPTATGTSQGPSVNHSSTIGTSYTPQSVLTKRKFSSEDPGTPSFRPRSNTEHHEYAEFRDWKRQKAMTAEAKEIRDKIDWAYRSYHKTCYNQTLISGAHIILEKQLLSEHRLWQVKRLIHDNAVVYRDPKLLEAISEKREVRCDLCAKYGYIVDEHFNPIEVGRDIRTLRDWVEWGPFVVLTCCCHKDGHGYHYTPSLA
ncbi:hypothetical protein KC343_g957 [Hortaea werneckii]|nr:hypothetical protein KC323_g8913 [Hortaea werneckii]KAI7287919.1 hypothetical protein KC352_g4467 [Hortaea werneckii]KAI7572386.1 hypothetical protein KC317_g807 [Hortaea werneckii]KAI7627554.1 hypothetical protein KC346_g697 [Hortaea werneckii]KAI7636977.1 hypothetical protein KC343_g957 [Hortaea werneckii]